MSKLDRLKLPKNSVRLRWLIVNRHIEQEDCLIFPFSKQSNGYSQFKYKGRYYLAHRQMCRWRHGKPPSKYHFAAHSCGNGHLGCINPGHLSWKTPKENSADRLVHGTMSKKLSVSQIRKIRRYLSETKLTYRQIGAKFGISAVMVHNIFHGRAWSCLR